MANRKQLTADDLIAQASDCRAVVCAVCRGEGFIDTDVLCYVCSGSGSVLVPVLRPRRPIVITGRLVLGIFVVFATVLSILLMSLSEYLSSR
jgi:hypothetical protein